MIPAKHVASDPKQSFIHFLVDLPILHTLEMGSGALQPLLTGLALHRDSRGSLP